MVKPRLFVGSASESLDVAYAVQSNLERDADVTVWTQGVFDLSAYTLDSLIKQLTNTNFAAFVLTGDDAKRLRNAKVTTPRDNVIFELGLFIGRLGRERCFMLTPRGIKNLHLPTDLLGLSPASYDPDRTDKNLQAALGPACHSIRRAIEQHSQYQCIPEKGQATVGNYNEVDIASILETWLSSSHIDWNRQVIHFAKVDNELGLPSGTAEQYLEKVVSNLRGYEVVSKGKLTIKLHVDPYIF